MANTHTNYQTSFRVLDPDGTALHAIQKLLFKWVATKEKDPELKGDRKKFYFRGEWRGLKRTNATVETDSYLDDGLAAWAFNYIHQDAELRRRRYWYTDVGLRQLKDEVVVFVQVAYGWNAQDLGHEQDPPQPSVPYFIRTIIKELKAFSGRHEFRLLERPLVFTEPAQNNILREFLKSEGRRYPLIVCNGDSERLGKEANRLATQLAGKAQVVVIADKAQDASPHSRSLLKEFSVRPGYLRVFFPFGTRPFNPVRHRWYDPSGQAYELERTGIVNGLLRNHGLHEPYAIESVRDVRHLVARAKLLSQLEKETKGSPEIAKLVALLQETEQERDELKEAANESRQMADYCAEEAQASQEQASRLVFENQTLKQRLEDAGRSKEPDLAQIWTSLPSSLHETVELAQKVFRNLSFSERAKKSAAEYTNCECYHEAWQIFQGLHHNLYSLKFGDGRCANLEQAFIEATGYELSMTESASTNRDTDLSRQRQLSHDGVDYDISPHVKHGNRAPKLLRVHFAFDEERKRIVIGYAGEHMDTAGTKRGRGR